VSKPRKVAIVTGASQGIGEGLVRAFRAADYRVIANSRSIKPSNDPDVLVVAGDISDRAVAVRIVAEGVAVFGRIDTLVNNAGVFIAKPFTQYTVEDYAAALSVNVAGFFHMTQAAMTQMEKQGGGHIVTISTALVDHALESLPSALAALTKGGLNAVTRSLAIEYAKRGIRVNAVSPGVIRTPMNPPETHAQLAALHPMARMGDVDDITQAVMYLDSAGFVTGEILHVDGGQSAGH
jgi:NAD(P)-dependent dehydrogenase (short-subunit alcohol dehydrogenase family)